MPRHNPEERARIIGGWSRQPVGGSVVLRGLTHYAGYVEWGTVLTCGTANPWLVAGSPALTPANVAAFTGPTTPLGHACQASRAEGLDVPLDAVYCPFCGTKLL